MSASDEKQDYIDKLERLAKGITKILDLPANRIVTPEIAERLVKLDENARLMLEKLRKGSFEIAVVGLEKAGKSSFSNALASMNILPTADERCTYTSTCIKPGDHNSATVTFLTSDEMNRNIRDQLELLRIPNAGSYNLDNLSLEKYEQLYQDCSEDIKVRYGDNVNQDIRELLTNKNSLRQYLNKPPRSYSEAEITAPDFKGFITDPAKAMAVKEIVIYSTQLSAMPNAILYDVPGFDSPTAMHKQQTKEKMNTADAIIAVANAKAPSLTSPALDVFREHDIDGCALSDKLFVFANKADLISDQPSLAKNRQTTINEWTSKRKILDPQQQNRIVFGSAFAAEGDEGAAASLASLGIDDGIQVMRDKLASYNQNERFEVLKKRIGKLMFDVKDLFEEAGRIYAPGSRSNYENIFGKILLDLEARLRPDLEKRLDQLKYDLNSALEAEKPLSADIRNRIAALMTTDKYEPQRAEIDEIHREKIGTDINAEKPNSLDSALRERRFKQMYGDFCAEVQGTAAQRHDDVSAKIRQLFLDAMGVKPGQEYYDELAARVGQMYASENQYESIYYDSLLERFARDLFEALIMYSHGQERLNKFRAGMANYLSMGVFYDAGDGQMISASPVDSIFWRLLLYPEIAQAPGLEELVEMVKKGSGLPRVGAVAQKLLLRLLAQKGAQTVEILEGIISNLPKKANEAVIASALKEALELATSAATPDVNELLEGGYLSDVQKRRGNYTYEDVRKEFANDVDALRLALVRAFVPAVDMETAFGARESRRIENIRNGLTGDEFRKFVVDNFSLIEAAKLGELKSSEAQRQADEAVMNEITDILNHIEKAA